MITLFTGQPGGGKTLYCVSKMLRPLIGAKLEWENDDGERVTTPYTIYSNIRGLLLEHELIDYDRAATWHTWCKPGDVIVLDECQKLFVRRPNGSKVPDHTHELEEHRGKHSVDFILITQHPMLLDSHVQSLVGRHLHMRRVANMDLSVIYEWDHCSKSLLFKNSVTKSPWRFDKSAYALYKSARAHTKQPRKLPGLVWFVLFGLVGAAIAGPTAISRISERMDPTRNTTLAQVRPDQPQQISASAPGAPGQTSAPGQASSSPASAELDLVPSAFKVELAGCIYRPDKGCICYTPQGRPVEADSELCSSLAEGRPPLSASRLPESNLPGSDIAASLEIHSYSQ